jgi:hypothetical protein
MTLAQSLKASHSGRPRSRLNRLTAALACLIAIAATFGALCVAGADAATPEHTDVMLLFDTSGSMGEELGEAKQEIEQVMAHVSATLPDVEFGVAEVRDYSPSPYTDELEEPGVEPWQLDQPLTSDVTAVQNAIAPLEAFGGGDGPEAYGRALWETDTNPTIGWRAGARHIIILVADNVPHDNDLDEGIPESERSSEGEIPPWNTGEELPGTWNIPGTTWTPGTNLDFQTVMGQLASDGKPLGMVDFKGDETGYFPYWQHWAGLSGGEALLGGSGDLASSVTTLIDSRASAPLPGCPAGEYRNATDQCVAVPVTETWRGAPADLNAYLPDLFFLPGALLELTDAVTPSATASANLIPPSIHPEAPFSVSIDTGDGDIKLSLFAGSRSGAPSAVSADPPLPQLANFKPPSAQQLLDGIHAKGSSYEIPLGQGSRSLTATLTSIAPFTFAATLDEALSATYRVNKIELDAYLGVAAAALIVLTLPEDAGDIALALAADGIRVAAGAIDDALQNVLRFALDHLPSGAARLLSSIPGDIAHDASTTWHSLTHLASLATAAAPAPVEGPPTSPARVLKLRARDLHGLRAQRLRGALAKAAQASLTTLPVGADIGPLVASRHLPGGGGSLTLLGGHLPGTKAQLVIAGPGYAAVRDVRITNGLAGGRIVLPSKRSAGRWYAGIIDYSGLHAVHKRIHGHQILEAASWVVR